MVGMTSIFDARSSKYNLSSMEVGDILTFDAPEEADKRRIRRAAHNQNERTDRHYATTAKGDSIRITRVR
jgi:hypothetical protein